LARRVGTPAGTRRPEVAKAAGSQRSKNSATAMSAGGRSQLSIRVSILLEPSQGSRPPATGPPAKLVGSPARDYTPRVPMRLPTVAALAAGLLAASAARAQTDPELRPTRGPFITDAARAGDADATAVELNPGSLGLLPAGDLQLVGAAAGESTSLGR